MGLLQRGSGEEGAPSAPGGPLGWFRRFREFLNEVWSELKKTTWPDRREVYGTTVVVIVAVVITGIFLLVVDKALEQAMHFVFTAFGR